MDRPHTLLNRMNALEDILEKFGMRKTACRLSLLKLFLDHANVAMSENTLAEHCRGEYDRATIYRTLNSFLEKGIVHKVVDDGKALKFALNSRITEQSPEHAHPTHVHFHCEDCEKTFCLEDIEVREIELPEGYKALHQDLLIRGTCKTCETNEQ